MGWLCPKCGADAAQHCGSYSHDGCETYRYYQCKGNPYHRFKTIEVRYEDAINIDKPVTELVNTNIDCPFCQHGEQNQLLNSETAEDTDIEVFVGRLSDVLRVKHYDLEGGTYDAREMFSINFCPMCGRSLKK